VRITIGRKIFAVACILLLLMLCSALLSTWKLRQSSNEADAVAHYFMPLANRITNVQAHLLQQEIIVQRILHDFDAPNVHDQSIDEHLVEFEGYGARVDEEIVEAVRLAEMALASVDDDMGRLELAQVVSLIQNLEQQHQEIHDLVVRTVEAHRAGKREALELLTDLFDRAQSGFDNLVSTLVSEILDFSQKSARHVDSHERLVLTFNIVATAIAVLLGLVFAAILTRSVVRPVRALRDGTRAIETGDLSRDIPVTTNDEIADLTRAFNRMQDGLRASGRTKAMFGKYVDPRVVEAMLAEDHGQQSVVAGEKKQVTVFFSDIAGFTPIGERLSSVGVVRLINEYLSLASAPIIENQGVIDKYIGDEVMAFWCTPFVDAGEEARLACRAALAQFEQLDVLRERLPDVTGLRKDLPEVHIRVGLASGEALVGSIGSDYARNFTAMGDTVNLGSRLEGANKVYGTRILICENTRIAAGDAVETREIDWITVAGKSEPMRVFELMSLSGGLSTARQAVLKAFEAALTAYRARDWAVAESGFKVCLNHDPDDGPARVFLERLAHLQTAPHMDSWDGVWRLTTKDGI